METVNGATRDFVRTRTTQNPCSSNPLPSSSSQGDIDNKRLFCMSADNPVKFLAQYTGLTVTLTAYKLIKSTKFNFLQLQEFPYSDTRRLMTLVIDESS